MGFAPRPVEQRAVAAQVGKAQHGVAALACAQKFARATNLQVAPGDLETIVGLHHRLEALACGFAQARALGRGVKQHADRRRRTAAHAPAQLVQLRQAKALGVLDHHQRRIGHVHAHFDHRGTHQHRRVALHKAGHYRFFVGRCHARVQQAHLGRLPIGPDHALHRRLQVGVGLGGVGQVERLALFNQWADPIDLTPQFDLRADTLHHLVAARLVEQLGDHRRAPGWQLVQGGNIQVGVVAHGQGARNRRGRHHQQVWLHRLVAQLAAQRQTLGHAKAVLLVDDGQRQVLEMHLLLDDGVGAHHQLCLAAFHHGQHVTPLLGLLRTGQPSGGNAQRFEPADEFAKVLLGQNFRGGHQRALPTGVDADRRRQRCHHGFASAHVALEQPVHGHQARHVARNFGLHALLRRRQRKRQLGQQPIVQREQHRLGIRPGGFGHHQRQQRRAQMGAHAARVQLRDLLRQQLFGLEPLPGRVAVVLQRGQRHVGLGLVQKVKRVAQRPQRVVVDLA